MTYSPIITHKMNTAAQRVLTTPELFCRIFDFLDDGGYAGPVSLRYDRHNLARCASIKNLWCQEIMHRFWARPVGEMNGLLRHFRRVKRYRRQFYANFVMRLNIMSVLDMDISRCNIGFRGLSFPQLEVLHLTVRARHANIPRICAPALEVLHVTLCIDPFKSLEGPVAIKGLFRLIKGGLPSLKLIKFDFLSEVNDHLLAVFQRLFPHVEIVKELNLVPKF